MCAIAQEVAPEDVRLSWAAPEECIDGASLTLSGYRLEAAESGDGPWLQSLPEDQFGPDVQQVLLQDVLGPSVDRLCFRIFATGYCPPDPAEQDSLPSNVVCKTWSASDPDPIEVRSGAFDLRLSFQAPQIEPPPSTGPPSADMPTALVTYLTDQQTSIDVAYPSGIEAGDGLIYLVAGGSDSVYATPSGLELRHTSDVFSPNNQLWTSIADGTESGTLTFTDTEGGATRHVGAIVRIPGPVVFDALAVEENQFNDSDTPTSPSVITTEDNAEVIRLLAAHYDVIADPVAVPSGHTILDQDGTRAGFRLSIAVAALDGGQVSAGATGAMVWDTDSVTYVRPQSFTVAFVPSGEPPDEPIEGSSSAGSVSDVVVTSTLRSMETATAAAQAGASKSALMSSRQTVIGGAASAAVQRAVQSMIGSILAPADAGAQARAQGVSRASVLSEGFSGSASSTVAALQASISETAEPSIAQSALARMLAGVTEPASAGDAASARTLAQHALIESALAADAPSVGIGLLASVAEGSLAGVATAAQQAASASIAESADAADSASALSRMGVLVMAGAISGEDAQADLLGEFDVTLSEGAQAGEISLSAGQFMVWVTETADGGDSAGSAAHIRALVVETAQGGVLMDVTERVSASLVESAAAGDAVNRFAAAVSASVSEGAVSASIASARQRAIAAVLEASIADMLGAVLAEQAVSLQEGAAAGFEAAAVLDSDRFVVVGEIRIESRTPVIRVLSISRLT